MKGNAAGTQILDRGLPRGDARQEARQQRLMDGRITSPCLPSRGLRRRCFVAGGRRGRTIIVFQPLQLPVRLRPFPEATVVQEVLCAGLAQLRSRQSLFQLMVELPEFQQSDKIRAIVSKRSMTFVGLLLFVQRSLARVLDFQGGGQDQHGRQATVPLRCQDNTSQPRIDGEPCDLTTQRRQLLLIVDGTNLEQRTVAILDRVATRRIEKGEFGDRAQAVIPATAG